MNATELGNRPASEMTYRQWLVGMAMQGLLANSNTRTQGNFANEEDAARQLGGLVAMYSEAMTDAILAREAQEAGNEK